MHIGQMSETILDVQILNGLSLLIGAMVQSRSLNLYHYHIIYDTVNLTGVSICMALTSFIENKRSYNRDRSVMIALFICLYIVFIVLFGFRLNNWNDKVPGHCYYYAVRIPFPNLLHPPLTDILYLTSTCISFSNSMGFCGAISSSPNPQRMYAQAAQRFPNKKIMKPLPLMLAPHDYKALLLLLATFQYAIHIYMIFAMRAANEHHLKGDSENSWGFGQVVAMVLLGSSVLQGLRAMIDYHKTTKEKSLDRLAAKKVGS
ncbi:hypothetical protein ZTR_08799 [Talaromyces verruculosus]|nr:hypothetical protein ZTR_08799 [Talaromyces verruculosus]